MKRSSKRPPKRARWWFDAAFARMRAGNAKCAAISATGAVAALIGWPVFAQAPAAPNATTAATTAASNAGSNAAGDVPDASPAERLLFLQNHLANVTPPRTLRYQFVREGAAFGRKTDALALALTKAPDGTCCSVHGDFNVDNQPLNLPDIPGATANPVLLYFLEYEVRDLHRQTKGGSGHFRQRIRQALVDKATITPTTVTWGGKQVAAQSVHIAPYLDDPFRSRFEVQSHKEYTFIISDAVPGGIYKMTAQLPAKLPAQPAPQAPAAGASGVPAPAAEPTQLTLTLLDPQPAVAAKK